MIAQPLITSYIIPKQAADACHQLVLPRDLPLKLALIPFQPANAPAAVFPSLPTPATALGVLMVVLVVGLVAWALQLMEAANQRREFSLMLAGCMVCSAAVGLATVMVLTLTSPDRLEARGLLPSANGSETGISLDAISLPWDGSPNLHATR